MLDKNDVIKLMKELNLPQSEYWITAGAGLVMHNIKETTRDIDLGCTTELANYLIENGCKFEYDRDGTRILKVNENVEAFENWFVDQIDNMNGISVASILSIRKQKVKLGREKDLQDIKRIDEFLNVQAITVLYQESENIF